MLGVTLETAPLPKSVSSLTYIFLIKRKGWKYLFKLSEPEGSSGAVLGSEEGTAFLQEEAWSHDNNDNNNNNKSGDLEVLECPPTVTSSSSHQGPVKMAGWVAPQIREKESRGRGWRESRAGIPKSGFESWLFHRNMNLSLRKVK